MFRLIRPGEKADYSVDWATHIGSDTISESAWAVSPTGPNLTGDSIDAGTKTTTVYVEGCVRGTVYRLVNTITTAAGRILDGEIILRCEES